MILKPPARLSPAKQVPIRVFLAGSIEMGVAEDWQWRAETHFKHGLREGLVAIFNPRRDNWDSSWEQTFENPQFSQQVNWELDALDASTHIFFYFQGGTKSPISLLELGLYAPSDKKVTVCCPKEFWRKGNVDIVCDRYGILVFEDLTDALVACKKSILRTKYQLNDD